MRNSLSRVFSIIVCHLSGERGRVSGESGRVSGEREVMREVQ